MEKRFLLPLIGLHTCTEEGRVRNMGKRFLLPPTGLHTYTEGKEL